MSARPHIGQIMAECDCQHYACKTRGYCMADRIEELEAKLAKMTQMWMQACDVTDLAGALADAESKLAKAVEALESVMVGGNHLAVWLPNNHPPAETEPLAALEQVGAGVSFDMWCCWRSIMLARTTLAELKGEDRG